MIAALARWEEARDGDFHEKSRRFFVHAQDYYVAKEAAKASAEKRQNDLQGMFGAAKGVDGKDPVSAADANDDGGDGRGSAHASQADAPNVYDCVDDGWVERRRRIESVSEDVVQACGLSELEGVSAAVGRGAIVVGAGARVQVGSVKSATAAAVSPATVDDDCGGADPTAGADAAGTTAGIGGGGAVVVELLENAIRSRRQKADMSVADISSADESYNTGRCLTLEQVSVSARLNPEQHVTFCSAGEALLQDFSDGMANRPMSTPRLRLLLHGKGGTRKSRVLSCLTTLCRSWQRASALELLAPTVIAAVNIGGRTLHSATGMGSWSASGTVGNSRRPSARKICSLVTRWAGVRLVAIDEASMMSKEILHDVDARLQVIKECGAELGNLHMVLCGDFTQLPPVAGQPIYCAPKKKGVAGVLENEGYRLYRQFTTVVIL